MTRNDFCVLVTVFSCTFFNSLSPAQKSNPDLDQYTRQIVFHLRSTCLQANCVPFEIHMSPGVVSLGLRKIICKCEIISWHKHAVSFLLVSAVELGASASCPCKLN